MAFRCLKNFNLRSDLIVTLIQFGLCTVDVVLSLFDKLVDDLSDWVLNVVSCRKVFVTQVAHQGLARPVVQFDFRRLKLRLVHGYLALHGVKLGINHLALHVL